MSKENSLKDFLADLYVGISSRKPGASKNPQDFRKEIESIPAGGSSEGGSAECSGEHVIKVDELPTEGIVQTNLYKMGDTYYKYSDAFKDILIVQDGQVQSFVEVYTGIGAVIELYYVKTRPTENIVVSGETADSVLFACYYVEYEDDMLLYMSGELIESDTNEWMPMATLMGGTNGGAITSASQATEEMTMYALVEQGWKPLGAAEYTGEVVIE